MESGKAGTGHLDLGTCRGTVMIGSELPLNVQDGEVAAAGVVAGESPAFGPAMDGAAPAERPVGRTTRLPAWL